MPNKPPISILEQIKLLQSRGLIIKDIDFAYYCLENISYYRLAGYWWPMQSDHTYHIFKPDSLFEDVVRIYQFDRELKLLVFSAIEQVEISFRTRLIYIASMTHGSHWYETQLLFSNSKYFIKNLEFIDRGLKSSKEEFIVDHKKRYPNIRPEAWKSLEILSLGHLSKLYKNLKDNKVKNKLANGFMLPSYDYLESWLVVINDLRNICAHHSRLWNRILLNSIKPLRLNDSGWISEYPIHKDKIYLGLCSLFFLLKKIDNKSQFSSDLNKLFYTYQNVDPNAMGFTPGMSSVKPPQRKSPLITFTS